MQCVQCGHQNPVGTKFCGRCGAKLTLICAACGTSNPADNKFCGECGTQLGQVLANPTDRDEVRDTAGLLTCRSRLYNY